MSVDTYYCFCCLSTKNLVNLFDYTDSSYGNLLSDLFSIKLLQEDVEDDSCICKKCAKKLKAAHAFKYQIHETLNVLHLNGLLNVEKTVDNCYCVKKVVSCLDFEEKYGADGEEEKQLNLEVLHKSNTDNKSETIEHRSIKLEKDIQDESNLSSRIRTKSNRNPRLDRPKKRKVTSSKKKRKGRDFYEVSDDFKCAICSIVLPNVYMYHKHMNQHYPNHICEVCGKGFVTEMRLKRHVPSHKQGVYKCNACDAEFTNCNTLSSHRQRKHNNFGAYKCAQCSLRFSTLSSRALHLAANHEYNQYQCTLCPQTFLLAGYLNTHMRNKHLRVKRYFCAECKVGFFHKQELEGHMTFHTGLKEYKCSLCPKRYPRKKALDVHMRVHTNDKRFTCDVCGKKFIQKCTLLNHIKTHNRTKFNDIQY